MLLNTETAQEYWDRVTPWHRWFAWRPTKLTDGRWVWLETVERRACRHYGMDVLVYWETRRAGETS